MFLRRFFGAIGYIPAVDQKIDAVADAVVDRREVAGQPVHNSTTRWGLLRNVGATALPYRRLQGQSAERLLSYGIAVVVVTQAAQGCMVYTAAECFHVPGLAVDVVDVTGAGDTFGGSFVAARALGQDLQAAARFANATAAICVGGLGARAGAVAWEVVAERMQMMPGAAE